MSVVIAVAERSNSARLLLREIMSNGEWVRAEHEVYEHSGKQRDHVKLAEDELEEQVPKAYGIISIRTSVKERPLTRTHAKDL